MQVMYGVLHSVRSPSTLDILSSNPTSGHFLNFICKHREGGRPVVRLLLVMLGPNYPEDRIGVTFLTFKAAFGRPNVTAKLS